MGGRHSHLRCQPAGGRGGRRCPPPLEAPPGRARRVLRHGRSPSRGPARRRSL